MPQQYYEIPEEAYLFGKQLTERSKEEKVRQWALFELLSFYRINIRDIKIEVPIKVGTRTHFADIVVYKEHLPYIVIECKHQEEDKEQQSIEQAISYANSNTLKAKFAIYTNGNVWLVKRKVEDQWVDFPDIPNYSKDLDFIKFKDLVDSLQELEPLLFWMYETVPESEAKKYFNLLESFFNPFNPLIKEVDNNLVYVVHYISLALNHLEFDINIQENEFNLTEYCETKMILAYDYSICYVSKYSQLQEKPRDFNTIRLFKWGKFLPNDIQNLFRKTVFEKTINQHESNLIRLLWVLIDYLQIILLENQRPNCDSIIYKSIKENITGSFLKFVIPLLEEKYGISLPDNIRDAELIRNLKKARWKEHWG
jgi:Holliday junction resolvase